MSLDYPNRADWLAKRYTPRVVRAERPVWNKGIFRSRRPGPVQESKSVIRKDKKARMWVMYREFFASAENQTAIAAHQLTWCIGMNPRLVRDTVLGSQHVG